MGLREQLCEIAKNGETTYYSDIAPSLGLDMALSNDRRKIGELLEHISATERCAGRPLLSAVVILKEDNRDREMPGQGFFDMAKGFGLLRDATDATENRRYWRRELRRVHRYWRAT